MKFFARGITAEALDAVERIERLKKLQADYYARLQSARVSSMLLKLVDELFVTPAITMTQAAKILKVGYTSAQKNVEKLVRAQILREISGAVRNRVYLPEGVVQAVEGLSSATSPRRTTGKPRPARKKRLP